MGCFPLFIRVWLRSRTFQDISKRAVVATEQKTCSKCFPCIFSSAPHTEPVTWVHGNVAKATPPKRQSWVPASLVTPPPQSTPYFTAFGGGRFAPSLVVGHPPAARTTLLLSELLLPSRLAPLARLQQVQAVCVPLSPPHWSSGGWHGKAKASPRDLPQRCPQHHL